MQQTSRTWGRYLETSASEEEEEEGIFPGR